MSIDMTTPLAHQSRDDYFGFLRERICNEHYDRKWAAITLTLKQRAKRDDGTIQRIDWNEASKCIRQLLKKISRTVYGAAYRRYGKSLLVLPVIEGGGDKHLHIHMLLEVPQLDVEETSYFSFISREWAKLRWALPEQKIIALAEEGDIVGWLRYILKDVHNTRETIDLDNTNL